MTRKHFNFRWLAIPWGAFGLIFAVVFGGIAWMSLQQPQENPSVRLAIPLYLFACYFVAAALINRRSAILTPEGVRVIIWPLPIRIPERSRRNAIRHCYLKKVVVLDDGTELEHYYMAGIETANDQQIDLTGPHKTEPEAIESAKTITAILNQAPGNPPLEIRWIPNHPPPRRVLSVLLLVGFWLAVALYTIYLGVQWEEAWQKARRAATACNGIGTASTTFSKTSAGNKRSSLSYLARPA